MKLNELFQAENLMFTDKNMARMYLKTDYILDPHTFWHSHNRIEIMVLLSGMLEVLFYDNDLNYIESAFIKKGQFLLIDENVKHNVKILSNDTDMLNLEFTLSPCSTKQGAINIRNYLSQVDFFKNFCNKMQNYVIGADTVNLKEIILKIHDTYFESSSNPNLNYLTDLLIMSFLLDVARCQLSAKNTTNNYHVNKVIRLLNLHLSKNITTDFLAEKIGVNKSYLQRLFKEHTGKTIITYLNELRIKQAKKLLTNKNFDIIDIAVEVGFNTRQNFAVAFKKNTGLTPSEYRKQNLNKSFSTY